MESDVGTLYVLGLEMALHPLYLPKGALINSMDI